MTEAEIMSRTVADAIKRIERLEGNEVYRRAWKKAASTLKGMLVDINVTITDKSPQISDVP